MNIQTVSSADQTVADSVHVAGQFQSVETQPVQTVKVEAQPVQTVEFTPDKFEETAAQVPAE